jgi:hypothetical protein
MLYGIIFFTYAHAREGKANKSASFAEGFGVALKCLKTDLAVQCGIFGAQPTDFGCCLSNLDHHPSLQGTALWIEELTRRLDVALIIITHNLGVVQCSEAALILSSRATPPRLRGLYPVASAA